MVFKCEDHKKKSLENVLWGFGDEATIRGIGSDMPSVCHVWSAIYPCNFTPQECTIVNSPIMRRSHGALKIWKNVCRKSQKFWQKGQYFRKLETVHGTFARLAIYLMVRCCFWVPWLALCAILKKMIESISWNVKEKSLVKDRN